MSATYNTAHGNAGSPTHWVRPGIEPPSSWIPVGLVPLCHNGNSLAHFCFEMFVSLLLGVFIYLFFFLQPKLWHKEVPSLGVESKLQLGPMPQSWQSWIQAASATYPAACGNVRSLIHWARPGIALLSSHIPGRVLNPLSHNRNSLGVLNIVDTNILLVIFMLQMFLLVSCFFTFFMFLLLFWPHPQPIEVLRSEIIPTPQQ